MSGIGGLILVVALLVVGAFAGLYYWRRFKQRRKQGLNAAERVQKAA